MRIGKRGFQARIKGDLQIEFGGEKLTSYAGLELLRRFLKRLDFFSELRRASKVAGVRGDFSFGKVVLTVLGMLVTGAKRVRHLEFLRDDPLFLRFAGLSHAPHRPFARSGTGADVVSDVAATGPTQLDCGASSARGGGRETLDDRH